MLSTLYCRPLYLLTPEYQAAASVVLTTTSTGTRSATALLEALIVRRIPFPALKNKTTRTNKQRDRRPSSKTYESLLPSKRRKKKKVYSLLTAMKRPLGPLKLSIHPYYEQGGGKGFG